MTTTRDKVYLHGYEIPMCDTDTLPMTTSTDPAANAAVSTAIVNSYSGVIITLTGAGNAQTIQSPTDTTSIRRFTVINNDTSTHSIVVNSITLAAGDAQSFAWDGSAWIPIASTYATATTPGVVELSTDAEAVTGSSTTLVVTPSNLTARLAAPGAIGGTTAATSVAIDNLLIDGNDISSTSGDITITPKAGEDVILDSHWEFDGPVMTAITDNDTTITAYAGKAISIESCTFDGGAATATTFNELTLTKQATGFTIAGGTTSKTLTVALDANVAGTNTGDITLDTNHGLALTNQVLAMGTPSSVTGSSTNAVSTTTHSHAIDLTSPPAIGGTAAAAGTFTTLDATTDVTLKGTTGGYVRKYAEATADISATHTITIQANVPAGSRLLGTQLRVDAALADGETWNAQYVTGATASIASAAAVAQNTKVNTLFNTNGATDITSDETDITIQRSSNPGVDAFTAQGTIRAIVYYETFDAMASL